MNNSKPGQLTTSTRKQRTDSNTVLRMRRLGRSWGWFATVCGPCCDMSQSERNNWSILRLRVSVDGRQPLTNRERCSLNLPRNVVPNQMLEPVALLDEHFQLVSLVHSILSSCFKNVLRLLIHLITTHLDEHTSITLYVLLPFLLILPHVNSTSLYPKPLWPSSHLLPVLVSL